MANSLPTIAEGSPDRTDTPAHIAEINPITFEARKGHFKQNARGEMSVTFVLHPQDIPLELLQAKPGTRFTVVAVELDDDELPKSSIRSEDQRNALTRSNILVKEHLFQMFLKAELTRKGISPANSPDVLDPGGEEQACILNLYSLLEIASRTEIRDNIDKTRAFISLEKSFHQSKFRK